eukprot:307084_1
MGLVYSLQKSSMLSDTVFTFFPFRFPNRLNKGESTVGVLTSSTPTPRLPPFPTILEAATYCLSPLPASAVPTGPQHTLLIPTSATRNPNEVSNTINIPRNAGITPPLTPNLMAEVDLHHLPWTFNR